MFERRTVRQASFWLAIILIAATSLLVYRSLKDLLAVSSSVERIHNGLFQLEHVTSLLEGARDGRRDFFITGDDALLESYRAAAAQAAGVLAEIEEFSGQNPQQRQRVKTIADLMADDSQALAEAVAQRRAGGLAAVDLNLLARGREIMGRIRSEIAAMAAEERRQLRTKEQNAQREAELALMILLGGTVVSGVAIIFVFLLVNGEVRRRRRAEHSLVELNAALEERVAERTAELAQANEALRQESEQRKRAGEWLRESNDRLTAVISAAPFGIYLLDVNGNVAMWNAGAERIFGYTNLEIVGRPPPFLTVHDLAPLRVDAANPAPGQQPRGVDLDLPRNDGKTIHARLFAAEILAGGSHEALHIVEDITERRNIEQQLRQSQKMEVVGQLTGGMAHDFNNLLTIILGNLDMAREGLDAGMDVLEQLETAIKGATRGAELTQRLLAFARKQTLQPRLVNVNDLLTGTVAMLKRTLGESIVVSVSMEPKLWPAVVDPSQVEDAILNLAVNARDAMPNGGQLVIETGNATLDANYVALNPGVVPGNYVMLAVGDTGVGMSAEILERAFEPFFTTKEKNKGTGLGLSMIYGFVKQSGGHIKIYSEPGHGTTVRIYLPRARSNAELAEYEERPPPLMAAPAGTKVLVVEDNEDVRRVAVRMLDELGYQTIEAAAPDEAIATLEQRGDIDILFTDIVMPGKRTGYDLAQDAQRMRPDLRVLFTSGYSEVFLKQGSTGLRAQILGKPYRKKDLAAKLAALKDEQP